MKPKHNSARSVSGNGSVPPARTLNTTASALETLDKDEKVALLKYESIIQNGLLTFWEVCTALASIRKERLYRADFKTFEDYCQERLGFGRAYANRLIQASESKSDLAPIDAIPASTHETQLRPLAGLTKEEKNKAWTQAVAKANGKSPTAAEVRQAVNQVRGKDGPKKSKVTTVTSPFTEPLVEARELVARLEALLQMTKGGEELIPIVQKLKGAMAKLKD